MNNTYLQTKKIEKWFEHVQTIQYALESNLNKTIPTIREPHIREAIEKILDANKHHTKVIEELFDIIDKKPNKLSDKVFGEVVEKLEGGLMRFQDLLGGATGSWQHMHHLVVMNQQAMGAFAISEQLGLSLGMKEIVGIGFSISHEKTMHQMVLQEYMLEMAPKSILYNENV